MLFRSNDWILAGSIYEKKVLFKRIRINYDFSRDFIQNSSVMVYFEDSAQEINQAKSIIDRLISGIPLLIQICGKDSEKYFDYLLETLSNRIDQKHTMTVWSYEDKDNISEWLFDFFECAYPDEERFDEWNEYRILVLCEELFAEEILNAIKAYLKNSKIGRASCRERVLMPV